MRMKGIHGLEWSETHVQIINLGLVTRQKTNE